jgi:hypothetical protein
MIQLLGICHRLSRLSGRQVTPSTSLKNPTCDSVRRGTRISSKRLPRVQPADKSVAVGTGDVLEERILEAASRRAFKTVTPGLVYPLAGERREHFIRDFLIQPNGQHELNLRVRTDGSLDPTERDSTQALRRLLSDAQIGKPQLAVLVFLEAHPGLPRAPIDMNPSTRARGEVETG